jgi:hypothetical protein
VWKDPTSGKMAPFHRGLDLPYCFKGHTVARVDKGSVSARQPAPKSVAIPDLHRAGTALKMNLDHLDRPAAMVGVYGNAEEGNGVPADVTARTFHGELLKRLSSYRGQWQDNAYVLALAGALADISAANDGKLPTAAVCLVIGHRAAVVATQGARLYVFTGAAGETQPCDAIEVGGAATCYQEVGLDLSSAVSVVLTVGESCLDTQKVIKAAAGKLYPNHCRASNISVFRAMKDLKAVGSVAAASARINPVVSTGLPSAVPAKAGEVQSKARVAQILIRYWKGTGTKPVDPVRRRKQITRTLEEAENIALDALERLLAAGASFTKICKSVSECESALKGGDQAGDLGWVEPPKDVAMKAARNELVQLQDVVNTFVPEAVMKAAFEMQVGDMSDLVTSEIGIHLMWRTG